MAKSKNASQHNQGVKNHKNGIKKAAPLHKFMAQRGSWLPGLVNLRRVRKNNQQKAISARRERLQAFQKKIGKK